MSEAFTFDGRSIPIHPGDTFASALHRAGVRAISRSMKYHRPRGLYCNVGSCASCFVDVDGVANVPACMEAARPATVASQNRIGSAERDLLRVVDRVYPDGFDPHGAFTSPGVVNRLFVKSVRFMSGWGKAPALDMPPIQAKRRVHQVDEIIIGGGRHGLARLAAMAGKAGSLLLVEEQADLGGDGIWDPEQTAEIADTVDDIDEMRGVTIWTDALAFGIYGRTVAIRRGDDLHEVTAKRITVATGRHDAAPVFPGNDLPGILTERAARRLWYGHKVLPGQRIVIDGAPLCATFTADLLAAGAELLAIGDVEEARGAITVDHARIDESWHNADCIIVHRPGVPRMELLQQAGCNLTWNDGVAPVTDLSGNTTVEGIVARFTEGV